MAQSKHWAPSGAGWLEVSEWSGQHSTSHGGRRQDPAVTVWLEGVTLKRSSQVAFGFTGLGVFARQGHEIGGVEQAAGPQLGARISRPLDRKPAPPS